MASGGGSVAEIYRDGDGFRLHVDMNFQPNLLDMGLLDMTALDSNRIAVRLEDANVLARVEAMLCQECYSIIKTFSPGDAPADSAAPPPVACPYERVKQMARAQASFFVTGAGGSGKSFLLWEVIMELVLVQKKKVTVAATTGIAADTLSRNIPEHVRDAFANAGAPLPDVSTFHAAFAPPWNSVVGCLGVASSTIDKMARDWARAVNSSPALADRWSASTHIIDEISLMESELWEVYCATLAHLKGSSRTNTIVSGDFFQLPPVAGSEGAEGGQPQRIKRTRKPQFCFVGENWRSRIGDRVCVLNKNYRSANPEWEAVLARLRVGQMTVADKNMLALRSTENIRRVLTAAGSSEQPVSDDHVRLFHRREKVADYNNMRIAQLIQRGVSSREYKVHIKKVDVTRGQGAARELITNTYAAHAVANDLVNDIIKRHGAGESAVTLCVDARVMLTANIDISRRLVNGALGTALQVESGAVHVKFDHIDDVIEIKPVAHSRESFSMQQRYTATVHILPLAPAFAITIHKVQGTTLDKVCVDFGTDVTEPALVYVALSRVRRPEDIVIDGLDAGAWARIRPPVEVIHFYNQTFNAQPVTTQQEIHVPSTRVNIHDPDARVLMSRPPAAIVFLRRQVLERIKQEVCTRDLQAQMEDRRRHRDEVSRNMAAQRIVGSPRTPATPGDTLF